MLGKKLIAIMAAGIIGMAVYGGSGSAFAHGGHEHGATDQAAAKGGNELCPVTGEKVDAKTTYTYNYRGKVYHFCCADCLVEFKKDPEKYLGKTKSGTTTDTAGPMGHDHGHHGQE